MADLGISQSYFSCQKYSESDHVRITKVVGFHSMNPEKLVWHFSEFLQFSRDFLLHWTNLQENLHSFHYRQVLKFTQNTLLRSRTLQLGPWTWGRRGSGQFRRAGGAPGLASGWARPGAHLGSTGGRSWDGGAAGVGDRRRPVAVAAAAQGDGGEGVLLGNTRAWGCNRS
jgi:hypothetical protein